MLKNPVSSVTVIERAIGWARNAPQLSARALRYTLVGLGNGLVFGAVSVAAISLFAVSPTLATGLGYLCSVPLSFIGHRSLTFRSENTWVSEVARFIFVQLCCLVVSMLLMRTVTALQMPYVLGLLGAVLIIPAANFFIANFWVFAQRWKDE